jgi:hypothetical protein
LVKGSSPEVKTIPLVAGGNDQNGTVNGAHFLPALTLAQRALCAAAILFLPAAEMVLFLQPDFPARVDFPECCEGSGYAVQFIPQVECVPSGVD